MTFTDEEFKSEESDRDYEFKDWIPEGFQVKKVRRPMRKIPKWAGSKSGLALRVLGKRGQVRLRVAYLYWQARMNAREIGEALNKSEKSIRNILYQLRRE